MLQYKYATIQNLVRKITTPDLTMIRKITTSEKYVYNINQITPFNVQCVIKLHGELSSEVFLKAIKLIQQQHPHLRIALTDTDPVSFVDCHKLLPYQIISKTHDAQWKIIAEKELNLFINEPYMPLARVIFLQGTASHEIIFTSNHIIADGISLCHMAISFYKYCAQMNEGITIKINEAYQDRNLEELLPNLVIDHTFTEDDFKSKNEKTFGLQESNINYNSKTEFIPYRFSEEETRAIINKSQRHHTSVHGVLSAAAIIALHKHLHTEKKDINISQIQYLSPINLRSMLIGNVSPEELGHYVGCYFNAFSQSQFNSFWDFSQLIKSLLTSYIDSREPIKYILSQEKLLAKYATNEQLVDHIRWKGPVIGITNMGLFQPIAQCKSLQLEDMHLLASMPAVWDFPFAYFLGVLTVQQQLQIDLMYVTPTISQAQAQRYLSLFLDIIKEYMIDE
jgi:hypothetical protein